MDLVYAATNGGMGQDFKTKSNSTWCFKPFICEMRLREYKSILIDKGLNYFISVKLLIHETIVSQRPWQARTQGGALVYVHPPLKQSSAQKCLKDERKSRPDMSAKRMHIPLRYNKIKTKSKEKKKKRLKGKG